MSNILPFPAMSKDEIALTPYYREPTPEEHQEIAECLERMQVQILRLRKALSSKQAEIAAVKVEVECLLAALTSSHS